MSRLTRDGAAEPVSRDLILRHARGQRNRAYPFSLCSADHKQDWQPYPVDPYSCYICVTILPDHRLCADGMDSENLPGGEVAAAGAVRARVIEHRFTVSGIAVVWSG